MRILKNRVGRVIEPGKVDFLLRTVDEPKEQQVVIKIASSAICGSDLHIFKGKHPSAPLPVTIGHEFAGEVVAVGSKVSKVKIGDRVTVEPVIVCGKCRACRTGNYGYCENISFTYRVGDGAMADYITVEEPYVYKLPEHLSYSAGALIEPLAVAVHAVRRADIKLGEKVLVIGAGAIGILVAALCRRRGAT
ncbi:MAG: alcohol dehydrogenase catalytic domain-containing protein, partial [Tepidanaerobacteraceae bacterium]